MRLRWVLPADEASAVFQYVQHAAQIVPTLQDQPRRRDDRVGALLAREPRRLLDAKQRAFTGAAEHRERGRVAPEVDRVVAPLARGDLAAVDGEDRAKLLAVGGGDSLGVGCWACVRQGAAKAARLARAEYYWFSFAQWRLRVVTQI